MMAFHNSHLLTIPQEHNVVTGNCLCERCRELRLTAAMNEPEQERFGHFIALDILPRREERCLNDIFAVTIKQIVQGRAYKRIALENTGYKYFKSWAKNQRQFRNFENKEMEKFSSKINKCSLVFDKWTLIASNLSDPRITEIDPRRFSVNQFYQARSIDWCLSYNDILRQKKGKVQDPVYSDEKFDDIFNYIVNTGILGDIGHQENLAAGLGERLKMRMISHCRRRQHPY